VWVTANSDCSLGISALRYSELLLAGVIRLYFIVNITFRGENGVLPTIHEKSNPSNPLANVQFSSAT
jgi:hypothetical protein